MNPPASSLSGIVHADEAPRDESLTAQGLKQAADAAIAAGDLAAARDLLRRAVGRSAGRIDLWLALAGCHRALGESRESLEAVDQALGLDPTSFAARLMKGSLLETLGEVAQAAEAYGAALAVKPPEAALNAPMRRALERARSLRDRYVASLALDRLAAGRPSEALDMLGSAAEDADAGFEVITAQGQAMIALGRDEEAAGLFARAATAAPENGDVERQLAGALATLHRFAESEAATRRAFAKGSDDAETWRIRGRALQGLYDLDAAEHAYREAIRRRPGHAEAHADLAQLVWMRTADQGLAQGALDEALAETPRDPALCLTKARLLEYIGDVDDGYRVLSEALRAQPDDLRLHISASALSLARDPTRALVHAERALALAPDSDPAIKALCQAYLALGRPELVPPLAEALRRRSPGDQFPIALLGVAWRILGDRRYHALCDYDRLVRRERLDTPRGWSSLQSYLADLARSLRSLHPFRTHPVGQSVRLGSRTGQSLTRSQDPAIAAFLAAVDAPVRAYIDHIRQTPDELGLRAAESYRLAGAWSTMLRPGGHHVSHLHAFGWISSACHIEVPSAVDRDREGWMQVGEPGLVTQPPLAAEHFVKPEAGTLVLFPSYMWHGTIPFRGETPRLAVAFDVLPA